MQPTYAIVIGGVPPPRCPGSGRGGRIDVIPRSCRRAAQPIAARASTGREASGAGAAGHRDEVVHAASVLRRAAPRGVSVVGPCLRGVPARDRLRSRYPAGSRAGDAGRPRRLSPHRKQVLPGRQFRPHGGVQARLRRAGARHRTARRPFGVRHALSRALPRRHLVRRLLQGRGRRSDDLFRRAR